MFFPKDYGGCRSLGAAQFRRYAANRGDSYVLEEKKFLVVIHFVLSSFSLIEWRLCSGFGG
jgi:hypothetical protein